MERSIRSSKRRLSALDGAISVCDDDILKRKLQNQFERHSSILKVKEKRLTEFCNSNGIFKQNDRVRVSGFGKSVSQKAVHGVKRYVDKVEKRGIIKSITIDEVYDAAQGNDINEEVINTIFKTIDTSSKKGKFYINEVLFQSNLSDELGRTALMQTVPEFGGRQSLINIVVNADVIAGKTLNDLDSLIKSVNVNVANTFEEAIIHETGHAKLFKGKSLTQIKNVLEELSDKGISGISAIALEDGAECIAEIEVLKFRGSKISSEAESLYNRYIRSR